MGEEQFCREQFSDSQIHALTVCTLVASLLSVIGSSFMLENFFLYDKGRNPLTKLVAWLAFGDYLTAVNNIITSIMLLHYPDLFGWEVCIVMRAWFQIAAGSTWCYTSVIAYFLYRFMVSRNTTWVSWPLWIAFHFASWGVPAVGVVVMIAGNFVYKSPNTGLCYPSEPWHIILWFIPIIISFAWMLLCYTGIFYKVCRSGANSGRHSLNVALDPVRQPSEDAEAVLLVSKDDDKRVQFRHVVIRFSFYILVFFVCWFFDVITYFILFFNDNCNVYAFTFGYTLFRNLQGMLDCLVYGMTNLKIRQRFTHSILSAIVSTWELLLAPVLVLPAFIAYTSKLLQPYLSSDKSDKIFVSINDDLMKEHRKADRKKYFYSTQLPARYYGGDDQPAETWEEREARKAARRLHDEAEAEKREKKMKKKMRMMKEREEEGKQGGGEEVELGRGGEEEGRRDKQRRGPDGRRLIPAYYFNGEPSPNERKKKQEQAEQSGGEKKEDDVEDQRAGEKADDDRGTSTRD